MTVVKKGIPSNTKAKYITACQKISLKKYFDYKKTPKDFEKPSEEVMEIFEVTDACLWHWNKKKKLCHTIKKFKKVYRVYDIIQFIIDIELSQFL